MKKLLLFILIFISTTTLFAQTYNRGAVFDPNNYERVDLKPKLLTRNYTILPRSVSLKQYSPTPEEQGIYGTCVGWAVAFTARTMYESIALNRTDKKQNSANVFSPLHAYLGEYSLRGLIPSNYANSSFLLILDHLKSIEREGNAIEYVLEFIKKEGAVKRPDDEAANLRLIYMSSYLNLKRYPIAGYAKLFVYTRGVLGTIEERVNPVKKSLSEGKPVIICMNAPLSFNNAKNVWRPYESAALNHGGHAMCVIGYNDDIHGGAFEIQNSWGTEWGNDGYIWITYNDFAKFVDGAYEIIENLALYKEAAKFSANIEIELYNSREGMPVTYDKQGFYKTSSSYKSGTEFRFLMNNKFPAYIYAFASDSSSTGTEKIFPLKGISPVMDYLNSTIAWPGEHEWIKMDENIGTDYLVVLFSKEALDIDAIQKRFTGEKGTFPERVSRAVGNNFIPYNNVQYKNGKIEFNAESTNPKSVFGLLLAIDHIAR